MQNDVRSLTLSHEQFLLVTLIVKLAVTAVLSTMLARFRLFRRILLTERRDWPERLIFAAAFGIPLTAGVAARLLLHYDAADLTLSGSFLAGLIAGLFSERTGLPASAVESALQRAEERGLIERDHTRIQPTELGRRFLTDLQSLFLPAERT